MQNDSRIYQNRPLVGVAVVLLCNEAVLLIRRGRAPALGEWSFPGGAQKLGETAEAAARRELLEETGTTAGPLRLAAHADSIHHGESGAVRFHYTILDFSGRWASGKARAGGDAAAVAWVRLDALAPFELSDDVHRVLALCLAGDQAAAAGLDGT